MATLALSTLSVGSGAGADGDLYTATERLIRAPNADPFNILRMRDDFQEKALKDVTMNSGDAAMMSDPYNPVLVKGEMEAQKDYFRRLKFTYLESEAKRNFVLNITGEEPEGVQPGENEELERINAQKKAGLKSAKADLDDMRDLSIQLAAQNAEKYQTYSKQMSEMQSLYAKIKDAELEIQRIRATHPPENRLTPAQAEDILDKQITEIQRLTEDIGSTTTKREQTSQEVAQIGRELQRLQRDREREEARAREVRDGREAGETKVDDMCRWLNSAMAFYRTLFGIRSVRTVSPTVLHLEYDAPMEASDSAGQRRREMIPVTLEVEFDESTKRLKDARLLDLDLDIAEAVGIAVVANDVPGLVAEVLMRLRPVTV